MNHRRPLRSCLCCQFSLKVDSFLSLASEPCLLYEYIHRKFSISLMTAINIRVKQSSDEHYRFSTPRFASCCSGKVSWEREKWKISMFTRAPSTFALFNVFPIREWKFFSHFGFCAMDCRLYYLIFFLNMHTISGGFARKWKYHVTFPTKNIIFTVYSNLLLIVFYVPWRSFTTQWHWQQNFDSFPAG